MQHELFFYEKDDFYEYKDLKETEGYTITSITKYLKDTSLIQDVNIDTEIIDISALVEFPTSIQSLAEQTISLFNENTIFIADSRRKAFIEYELRFVFEKFGQLGNLIDNKYESTNDKIIDNKKRHKKITDLDEEELDVFLQNFKSKLYGHEKFKDDFEELVKVFRLFNKLGEHKILSLFLMGESGVGKTEVAKTIYNCLDGKNSLAKVNFGNYSNEFSLSSLIGSARGYTGSDDGEIFIRIRNTDIGVLLIDEFEKSNSTLFNYFLDVLESGKIISSLAEEIDLNGFIIVFTSNISKDDFKKKISPELRSRFDYKCLFTLLNNYDKEKYVEFRIKHLIKKINIEYKLKLDDNILCESILNQINVSTYNNMRDINKNLKKIFLRYIREFDNTDVVFVDENKSTISIGKKIINMLKI